MRHVFHVQGMDCADESRVIDGTLRACPGVKDVQFDLMRQRLTVICDPRQTSRSQLAASIQGAGFEIYPENFRAAGRDAGISKQMILAVVAALLFLSGCALTTKWLALPIAAAGGHLAGRALLTLSLLVSGRHVVPRAWRALRQGFADMNLLVSVAAVGALLLGEWIEGALVVFLFSVAHLLEAASAAHVRKSIARFLELMPLSAIRIVNDNGLTETVPLHALRQNDLLLVKPGSRVPADGVVESGWSSVDQSALTGEAVPAEMQPGSAVLAGTINGSGTLRIRATRDAAHARGARLRETVEQAQALRSPTERWVERFARSYTPVVILLAALVAVVPPLGGYDWREWVYHSLVVLLIACPCALVISTPVTMVSAVSALARAGVLVRGGESLERAGSIRAIAFDKTGVLTTGDLRVRQLLLLPGAHESYALARATAVETLSEHPVARALVAYAADMGPLPVAGQFQAIPGLGGEGMVEGCPVWVGSPALAKRHGAWTSQAEATAREIAGTGGALVVAGSQDCLWLIAALADSPRPEAARALRSLSADGMRRLVMLSGDHPANCEAVARAIGLGEVHPSLLPEDKLAMLRCIDAVSGPLAMVGDGINDAPAMAAASFSIAAGQRAADVTLHAADAVVWDGDLQRIPLLFKQSRKAMRIVRQNIVLAVGSKAAFVVLAAVGVATLWMAVLADVGATLLVTANGLRLMRTAQGKAIETNSPVVAPSTSS